MKRFYKVVTYGTAEKGWPLLLDGKQAKTPSGNILTSQNKDMAEAIAAEWNAQTDEVDLHSMPITQIQTTKIDFIDDRKQEAVEQLLGFVDTDLLLYQVDNPSGLVERQKHFWQTWLDWMEDTYMIHYKTTTGLNVVKQDQSIHDAIETYVRKLDKARLAIFYITTNLSKSLILPIAFIEREASAQDLFQAVQVEEIYKQNFYDDIDPDTKDIHEKLQYELMAAETYLELLD